MSEVNTITLSDIRAIPELNEAMIQPGDTYTIGEDGGWDVTRVFSDADDKLNLGIEITQEHLDNQPELVDKFDIEVGDRWIEEEDKFIKTGTDSGWKQFMYGFDEEPTLTGNIANILESWAGIGQIKLFEEDGVFDYESPEEAYGEGWNEADSETRRAMQDRARERRLLESYGRYFGPDDSTARTIGQFAGAIVDPATFIPIAGQAGKAITLGAKAARIGKASAAGGVLGGTYSVSGDLARGGGWGDVDTRKALETAGLAALGTGALMGTGAGISKLRQTGRDKKLALREANKLIDDTQEAFNRQITSPIPSLARINLEQSLSQSGKGSLREAQKLTGRTVEVPRGKNKAQQKIDDAVEDQTVSRFRSKGIEDFLGATSTALKNISQPLFMRARKFEFETRVQTAKHLKAAQPFMKSLSKIKGIEKSALSRHLNNGRFKEAEAMMPETMQKEFGEVKKILKELGNDLDASGVPIKLRESYFPRLIKGEKGYDNLMNHLAKSSGGKRLNELESLLVKEAKNWGDDINSIPRWRRYEIANQYMRGYTPSGTNTGSRITKSRVIDEVTDDLLPFYTKPEQALQMYIRNAVNTIERARFLGQHQKGKNYRGLNLSRTKKNEAGIEEPMTIDDSIGELVTTHMKGASAAQLREARDLLRARFRGGERQPNKVVGIIRDLGYMGTIANPISAITQLGDIGVSGALHGFRNTIAGMLGTKNVKLIDIGLDDVAQEFADISLTSNALRKLFGISQFRRIDTLGKETSMNAALRKNFKLVNRKSKGKLSGLTGEQEFRKKWGKAYAEDIENVIADFKSGKVTDLIKFHAFNELSDIQPISMLEMPKKYLEHPNGRILYALKTFTLKQYDIVRRDVIQEWKKGSKIKAAKQAALLAGWLTAANVGTMAAKDMMMGRDPNIENIGDNALWALLGVYGFNKYGSDKYLKDGKLTEWAINTVAPATPMIDAALTGAADLSKEDPNLEKHIRAVPLVGGLVYNWFGGGAEKYNERLEKERIKEWWGK